MNTPLLSDLREPPVVGRFYMVPAIQYQWHSERDEYWPVFGPLHEDAEFFDFTRPHYHIDVRFLSASQYARSARVGRTDLLGEVDKPYFVERAVGSYPLSKWGLPVPKGLPALIRRRCRTNERAYAFTGMDAVRKLNRHYCEGRDAAEPIRRADGRLLCPHRKADLSQFAPDADGIVTCPLHGLRVRCAA